MKQNFLEKGMWTGYFICDPTPEDAILDFKKHGFYSAEMANEHGAILLDRCGGDWTDKQTQIKIGDKTSPDGKTPTDVGREFGEFLKANGFSIPQAHLYYKLDLFHENAVEFHLRWMELYLAMGVKNLVLHVTGRGGEKPTDEQYKTITENLSLLAKRLENTDAYLCLENMRDGTSIDEDADRLLKIIEDAGGSEHLGICLDTGHLNFSLYKGYTDMSHGDFIRKAGSRLHALHIANNDGTGDLHCLPFNLKRGTGRIVNWKEVIDALKEIGYHDLFNFEVPGESQAPKPLLERKADYISFLADYMLSEM